MRDKPLNVQSGEPVAESTFDTEQEVASAAEREGGHYEPDPDQIVKYVHQVRPDRLPLDTTTDFDRRGGAEVTSMQDVRVTPATASVHEALPDEDEGEPG